VFTDPAAVSSVFIATGSNFPDALGAAAATSNGYLFRITTLTIWERSLTWRQRRECLLARCMTVEATET
jgi:hypothetical protein